MLLDKNFNSGELELSLSSHAHRTELKCTLLRLKLRRMVFFLRVFSGSQL